MPLAIVKLSPLLAIIILAPSIRDHEQQQGVSQRDAIPTGLVTPSYYNLSAFSHNKVLTPVSYAYVSSSNVSSLTMSF